MQALPGKSVNEQQKRSNREQYGGGRPLDQKC
jgi:hypothetical protein